MTELKMSLEQFKKENREKLIGIERDIRDGINGYLIKNKCDVTELGYGTLISSFDFDMDNDNIKFFIIETIEDTIKEAFGKNATFNVESTIKPMIQDREPEQLEAASSYSGYELEPTRCNSFYVFVGVNNIKSN